MEWVQFVGADKRFCMETTQIGGASYIELLICLEMARDEASPNTNSNDPDAIAGAVLTERLLPVDGMATARGSGLGMDWDEHAVARYAFS
jgi:hypothetical protein